MNINYQFIADAMACYRGLGYIEKDVPWLVNDRTIRITCPKERPFFWTYTAEGMGDCPVASGEQSFLEIRKHLVGKYVCATPCFRIEPEPDDLHRISFFKVELIHARPKNPQAELFSMISDALRFFSDKLEVEAIRTFDAGPMTYDIVSKNDRIELGSYGVRLIQDFDWVYGTGCAEPRLTQAIAKSKKET